MKTKRGAAFLVAFFVMVTGLVPGPVISQAFPAPHSYFRDQALACTLVLAFHCPEQPVAVQVAKRTPSSRPEPDLYAFVHRLVRSREEPRIQDPRFDEAVKEIRELLDHRKEILGILSPLGPRSTRADLLSALNRLDLALLTREFPIDGKIKSFSSLWRSLDSGMKDDGYELMRPDIPLSTEGTLIEQMILAIRRGKFDVTNYQTGLQLTETIFDYALLLLLAKTSHRVNDNGPSGVSQNLSVLQGLLDQLQAPKPDGLSGQLFCRQATSLARIAASRPTTLIAPHLRRSKSLRTSLNRHQRFEARIGDVFDQVSHLHTVGLRYGRDPKTHVRNMTAFHKTMRINEMDFALIVDDLVDILEELQYEKNEPTPNRAKLRTIYEVVFAGISTYPEAFGDPAIMQDLLFDPLASALQNEPDGQDLLNYFKSRYSDLRHLLAENKLILGRNFMDLNPSTPTPEPGNNRGAGYRSLNRSHIASGEFVYRMIYISFLHPEFHRLALEDAYQNSQNPLISAWSASWGDDASLAEERIVRNRLSQGLERVLFEDTLEVFSQFSLTSSEMSSVPFRSLRIFSLSGRRSVDKRVRIPA